jgi:RimJ/RimL family protein N-acetyltransferase
MQTEGRRGPAYRVETERLVMRCWSPADARLVRTAIDSSDAHLRRWIPFMRDEPRSLPDTVARLRQLRSSFDLDQEYRYAFFDREERTLLGGAGLFRRVGPGALEIGYWISAAGNGKGYATEATAALVRVAFELLGIARVEIHCATLNAPSSRVPEKLGFTHEATLGRRGVDGNGDEYDLMIWTLFADRYPGSPAAAYEVRAYDGLGDRVL